MINMDKYKLTEIKDRNGSEVKYIWHPGVIPEGIPVQQVYGFSLTKDNLVMLVKEKDDDRFTPPGGGSEEGETAVETLKRELLEEGQFEPQNIRLLGSLEVVNPDAEEDIQKHNLQVRFVCDIDNLEKFVPMQDGETKKRIFVYYKDMPEYVGFIDKYTSGRIQYDMFVDHIEGKIEL